MSLYREPDTTGPENTGMKETNAEIAALLAVEPEKGFRLLVARFSEPIYRHVRRLVVSHADAQDITQETFLKIFRSAGELKEPEALRGWIYRIATNEALRHLRRSFPVSCSLDDAGPDVLALKADEYTDYSNLEAVKLQRAINTLPTKQRVAFNLRYYDELGYDEIAAITGSTASSAKVSYHIAKNRIINYMNSHD